jgi:hypothetical protein
MLDSNGTQYTIKYLKASKLYITRYISGSPLKEHNSARVAITKDYFPSKFLFLKELIDSGSIDNKRYVLSLLTISRSIIPKAKELPKADYSTITDPYKGKDYTIPKTFIEDWVWERNLHSRLPKWDMSNHYISNKSSPFGKATQSALFGLFCFIQTSHTILENWIGLIGENKYKDLFEDTIKMVWKDHRTFISTNRIAEGKLSIVKDPELKMRVIAMVDYYSQFLLRPIHNDLLRLLKKLKCDRTYTQDPRHTWGKTMGNSFWSLDLSAATDRFPIKLQEKLIGVIYKNTEFASAWNKILTQRNYMTPEGNQLRYSVGQPMGAYSSWAAFTITHHLVVAWAAHLCGLNKFDKYIILGDDIVINNDKVARKYISIMTRLGVDISKSKTHVSKNTYEFAKRWIQHKVEITGLPVRGITNNIDNLTTIITNVVEYIYKVKPATKLSTKEILIRTLKNIKVNNRFYSINKLKYLIESVVLVIRYNKEMVTYEEIRNYFSKYVKSPDVIIPNQDKVYSWMSRILSIGLVDLAEKSGNSLSGYYNKFLETFPDIEKDYLKNNPIVHGLYEKLLVMRNSIRTIKNNDKLDLVDILQDIRIDEPDKLVEKVRNTSKPIQYIDKLWRQSIKVVDSINEYNYGNYNIDFNFSSDKPFETYVETQMSEQLDKLDQLRSGYQAPTSPQMQLFM